MLDWSAVLEVVLFVAAVVSIFVQVRVQGRTNAEAIAALKATMERQHTELKQESERSTAELHARIDTLFSKWTAVSVDEASTKAAVDGLVPRVERVEKHVDTIFEQAAAKGRG